MKQRDRRYWIRLISTTVLILIIVIMAIPILLGGVGVWALTHPACGGDGAKPSLPYREISIPSQSGSPFRGFFISGTKDATVIVPPAYNGGRGGMLPEASILAADGFNVLLFESRICAGRPYTSLGYQEVDDIGDVLAYLKQNPDNLPVNMARIALHGFSSAGATSTMAMVRYPEITALLAEGGYHNIADALGYGKDDTLFMKLAKLGIQVGYRFGTGSDISVLVPVEAVVKIPPRPIYLVYGTVEPSLGGAKEQLAAVKKAVPDAFIQLWEVPGAEHGGYLHAVGSDVYRDHVVPFYNCALLQQCEAWIQLWSK